MQGGDAGPPVPAHGALQTLLRQDDQTCELKSYISRVTLQRAKNYMEAENNTFYKSSEDFHLMKITASFSSQSTTIKENEKVSLSSFSI